jgi:hypothetical protein
MPTLLSIGDFSRMTFLNAEALHGKPSSSKKS